MSGSRNDDEAPGTETLFLTWALEEARDDDAFEAFLRERPDHRDELRRLWGEWNAARLLLRERSSAPASGLLEEFGGARGDERYTVRGELGRGGMGTVLRVWDHALRRESAMKTLRPRPDGRADDESRRARFLQEAQVTGRLEHPGIVPVHDIGLDGERPFFTMSLVQGRDFADVIEDVHAGRAGWTLQRALGVLQRVCEAVGFAHDRGVVHRDLKPSNVRVGDYGEVFVMDWGLARVDEDEDVPDGNRGDAREGRTHRREADRSDSGSALATQEGTVLGTPHYMAPEQARGEVAGTGRRSDVYAVGAMLYHLLCGHSPYSEVGEVSSPVALARVIASPPPSIESLAPDGPPELVAVCRRAMARRPSERYPSISELGADLRSYLEGRVVRAYRTGAWAELRTWMRRNRALAAAIAVAFLALAGIALSETLGRRRERKAREQAVAERQSSDEFARILGELVRENPYGEGIDAAVERLEQRALEIASDPERDRLSKARLKYQIGVTLSQLQESPRAEPHLRAAYEAQAELLGPVHPTTLDSGTRLAFVLVSLGRGRGGERLARALVEACVDEYGESDEKTLNCQETLAYALRDQGRVRAYTELMEHVVGRRRGALPEGDPVRLNSETNLAYTYLHAGRLAEAEVVARDAVAACERHLGEEEQTVHEAREALGRVLAAQGDVAGAEALLRRALAGRRAAVGESHPRTLDLQEELADLLVRSGRASEAVRFTRASFEERLRTRGIAYPSTVRSALVLARALDADLRSGEAEELVISLVDQGLEEEGSLTVELAVLLSELARRQLARGDLPSAEAAARDVLRVRLERLGADHHRTLDAMDNLARVLAASGQRAEAEALRREALQTRREVLGPADQEIADAQRELAELLQAGGRPEEARRLLDEAQELEAALRAPVRAE